MSEFKKNQLDKTGFIHLWKTIEAMLGTKVDKIEGFGLSSNDYTTEEKKKLAGLSDPKTATTENNGLMSSADKAKLDGIEAGANKSEEDPTIILDKLNPSDKPVADDTNLIVKNSEGVYSRSPLILLWNWLKAKTDTLYAVAGHTHNYAGSPEPGGDALTTLTVRDYNNQSNTIQIGWSGSDLSGDNLAYIAGYTPDKKIHTCSKGGVQNYIGLNNYLPLIGGTMSGALNFANNTWNPVGDDVQIGDRNTSGSFYVQGLNGPTNIKLKKKGDTSAESGDSATITYDGGNLIIDKTIQANLSGFASGTLFDKEQLVSLTDLDQNTWYPVVSMNQIPSGGLHHIKCNVQLDSGSKPSWSTHGNGFTVNLDMLVTASGWGTTHAHSICLDNDSNWVTSGANPAGYSQMGNGNRAVFWLRGGGQYRLYADWDANWDVKTSTYTDCNQSVSPTKSYPGVSYNKATLEDNKYPVGAIYMSTSSTSPASFFGGTQERIKDRFLLAAGDTYAAGRTGGEATHKLTIDEMPSHTHVLNIGWGDGATDSGAGKTKGGNSPQSRWTANYTGGSAAHNNMPPYLSVYMWKRVS